MLNVVGGGACRVCGGGVGCSAEGAGCKNGNAYKRNAMNTGMMLFLQRTRVNTYTIATGVHLAISKSMHAYV